MCDAKNAKGTQELHVIGSYTAARLSVAMQLHQLETSVIFSYSTVISVDIQYC
jgi:hypothetical protein